ncbi:hypothetical protein [uncultured Lacinutrix sp.]|uniref:hypothetical protein n=1 Tax=uncultured Lacinutrix sp. TaxID=574032 RepID=UPI002611FA46|nr:hypothetical protein [uncultured Lacinutrix sp.]
MKQIITIIFFLTSIISYSQINLNFEEVQTKFGKKNITESKTDGNHFEVKKLNETETIKFTYNLENIATMIEVENNQSINNDRFHKLAKKFNPKFKLTSSRNTELLNLYYDSKNQLLTIKVYKTNKKTELNKIIFISDTKIILEIIPNIYRWK